MGVFDRITFRSSESGQFESSARSIANRVNWDTRTLVPGRGDYSAVKPWENIDPTRAREYSVWYRALVILSTSAGAMEIDVKSIEEEDGGRKFTSAFDHPAFWPICIQANAEETAAKARARMVWIAAQHGHAYAGIVRSTGKPNQIIPFAPYQARPQRIKGKLWYEVDPYRTTADADYESNPEKTRYLPAEDVIDISLPSCDGMSPDEPWYNARMALHEGHAGGRVRSARSVNSGRPRIALTTDQALKVETIKRIKEEYPAMHSGLDDQIIPLILDLGLKPLPIPYQPEYAAEEALNAINIRQISNFTGVPSTMLGDIDSRTNNSLENDIKQYFEFGVGVWLGLFEPEYEAKFLSPAERRYRKMRISFNRKTTRFADTKVMAELIRSLGAGAPVAKINEIRGEILGWTAIDDPDAKKLLIPKNMGDQGGADNQPSNPAGNQPGNQASILASEKIHDKDDSETKVFQSGLENIGETIPHKCGLSKTGGLAVTKLIAQKITKRIATEAERKAGSDSVFMQFAGTNLETIYPSYVVPDFNALAEDGGIWEGKDHQAIASRWLGECKEGLLDLAGMAKKGELDTVVKDRIHEFVSRMPDRLIEILSE